MSGGLCLFGYKYSVYTRAVLIALELKGVPFGYKECDPFNPIDAGKLRDIHPFGRVPVIQLDTFSLFETQAILGYIDSVYPAPRLTPDTDEAAARMRQVMSIVDSYLYWPLVRQVFSEGFFSRLTGEGGNPSAFQDGLGRAPKVLKTLDRIAEERLVLNGDISLADCLLWPMIDYFRMVSEGAALLEQYSALASWSRKLENHPAALITKPDFDELEQG